MIRACGVRCCICLLSRNPSRQGAFIPFNVYPKDTPRVHYSKCGLAIWYVAGVLVLCCVVIFTSEMMHAGMDGYQEGDGSRAGILFYTCY